MRERLKSDSWVTEVAGFGSGVTWERPPYEAHLSRDFVSPRWKDYPAVRVRLKEDGKKDREIVLQLGESNVVDQVTRAIRQHLHGPRDLS
ncbi:MAG TPA: hypothetical protein VJP85_00250 [Candidatus Baltobacteraceae bacterium]|nr:hypothetical protein [Candidatus Baltobacteraceae bacterium]